MIDWLRALWIDPDRPLTTHGPVVRFVALCSAVTAMCAVAALVVTLAVFTGKVDKATSRSDANAAKLSAIQQSRKNATLDSCHLLRGLIVSAGAKRHREAETREYLVRNDLFDCAKYVRDHVKLRLK